MSKAQLNRLLKFEQMYERPGEKVKVRGEISFVVRHFETLMAGNK